MQISDVKSTPLLDYLESLGGNIEVQEGKKVIKNFDNLESEIDSLYNGVGLRDISHYGIIELKGKDTLDYLHRIGTNATKDLPKEGIARTIFTNEKGKIIDKGTLVNFEDYQLLIVSAEQKMKVISWLNKYIITDDVKPADANDKYSLLELIGPQADSFITLICGNSVNNINPNSFKIFSSEGMIFFLLKIIDAKGNVKFWIIADHANAKKIINYLVENKGPFNFNLIGEEAYNSFRIERGIPIASNELNDQYNPHEAKINELIDSKKGCYIGQEVIARLETYDKVQRSLMGVVLSNTDSINTPVNLYSDGNEAGTITSAAYSLKLKKQIGLAYIRKAFCQEGKILSVKIENGNSLNATVVSLPFKK